VGPAHGLRGGAVAGRPTAHAIGRVVAVHERFVQRSLARRTAGHAEQRANKLSLSAVSHVQGVAAALCLTPGVPDIVLVRLG